MALITLWSGTVLVRGLSDSHSDKWARMRVIVSANGVLWGGHCDDRDSDASATITLVPRLLLVGVTIESCTATAEGTIADEVCVKGAQGLSRDVFLRPCGEAVVRTQFIYALRGVNAPSLSGLALVCLSSSNPRTRTPCIVTLMSNKHRLVLRLEPVCVLGLVRGGGSTGNNNDTDGGGEEEAKEEAHLLPTIGDAAGKPISNFSAKVKVTGADCGGEHFLYFKITGDGVSVGESGEGVTVAVRAIARTRFLGLISYKRVGTAQTMIARPLEVSARDVALLAPSPTEMPKAAAAAPVPASAPPRSSASSSSSPRTWASFFGLGGEGGGGGKDKTHTQGGDNNATTTTYHGSTSRRVRVLTSDEFTFGFDELRLFLRQLKQTPAIVAGAIAGSVARESIAAKATAVAAVEVDVSESVPDSVVEREESAKWRFAQTAAAIEAAAVLLMPPSQSTDQEEGEGEGGGATS